MKRDMDLIRNLLLEIEDGKTSYQLIEPSHAEDLGVEVDEDRTKEEIARLEYHLTLLQDAGWVKLVQTSGGYWLVNRMMPAGHDFLDSVRDPKIWGATKEGAKQAGGFSAELLKSLAKGLIKKQIERHTGVELDL